MRTIAQGLESAKARNALLMLATFKQAEMDGYGQHPFTIYAGMVGNSDPESNAQRTRRHWVAMGYEVAAEYAGPKAGREADTGCIVLCVLRPCSKDEDTLTC